MITDTVAFKKPINLWKTTFSDYKEFIFEISKNYDLDNILEEIEMKDNKDNLIKDLNESYKSWLSNLTI